jgi:hypothetical protein
MVMAGLPLGNPPESIPSLPIKQNQLPKQQHLLVCVCRVFPKQYGARILCVCVFCPTHRVRVCSHSNSPQSTLYSACITLHRVRVCSHSDSTHNTNTRTHNTNTRIVCVCVFCVCAYFVPHTGLGFAHTVIHRNPHCTPRVLPYTGLGFAHTVIHRHPHCTPTQG